MPIFLTERIKFTGPSLIGELASKTGSGGSDKFPCLNGYYGLIQQKLNTQYKSQVVLASIPKLLAEQEDFDIDAANISQKLSDIEDADDDYDEDDSENQISQGDIESTWEACDITGTGRFEVDSCKLDEFYYPRRLENIGKTSWEELTIQRYVLNVLHRLFYQENSGGNIAFNKTHKIMPMLPYDEDSEVTSPSDLVTQEDSVIDEMHDIQDLPILLKRILYLGLKFHIHGPSYVVAYLRAKNILASRPNSTKSLTPQFVYDNSDSPLLKYNDTDVYGRNPKILTNKTFIHAVEFFDWLQLPLSETRTYVSYKDTIIEFEHVLEYNHINLCVADFTKIDFKYFNEHTFQITSLELNSDYDPNIVDKYLNTTETKLSQLINERDKYAPQSDMYRVYQMQVEQVEFDNMLDKKMQIYDIASNNDTQLNALIEQNILGLTTRDSLLADICDTVSDHETRFRFEGSKTNIQDSATNAATEELRRVSFKNGILSRGTRPIQFKMNAYWDVKAYHANVFVIHEEGICIRIDDSDVLYYTTWNEIKNYIHAKDYYNDAEAIPQEQLPVGRAILI